MFKALKINIIFKYQTNQMYTKIKLVTYVSKEHNNIAFSFVIYIQ